MELKSVWVWLLLTLISLQGCRIEGCLEQERFALLQLRQFFNHPNYLQDWVEGGGNSDCCQWESVGCSNTTGRVTSLDLHYSRNPKMGEWPLNVSLFSPFQELQFLHLSDNMIAGCVKNEGFERLSHLSNLQVLYLGGNMFNDSRILSSLSKHYSLKLLSLRDTGLTELNNIKISRLSNLESLNLGGNNFNNSILSSLATLSSLKELYLYGTGLTGTVDLQDLRNLEHLSLSINKLNNSVLSSLATLSSLKVLYLQEIELKGTIDLQGWESLGNLEMLDMGNNEINKILFPKGLRKLNSLSLANVSISDGSSLLQSLGSFPALATVDLSFNNFNETITTNELHSFTNVEEFVFSNSFVHISLFQSIRAFTSLKSLDMSNCKLNGILIDPDLPTLKSKSVHTTALANSFVDFIGSLASLEYLSLSHCNLTNTFFDIQGICKLLNLQELFMDNNDLWGDLPWCLANLTSLQVLDISSNHFTGNISSSPFKVLTSIQYLRLSDNHFQIPISLEPFFNHSELKAFHAENNEIYAGIEPHSLVPNFQLNSILLAAGYSDGGSFPKFLYSQRRLQEIDLSHNNLATEFPNWLLDNNTKLEKLYLVNCSLSGVFQLPVQSHMRLKDLDISINSFRDHIPIEIGFYLPNLKFLNISRNAFDGSISSSFGDMSSLMSLDLSNNFLTGEIPEHLAMGCFSLEFLILSNNSLQGKIFSEKFNLTNLSLLQLDDNNFTGKIPNSLSNCSLVGLYLSDNNLCGTIPQWLGSMSDLVGIIMSNNYLEGPIPSEFCKLEHLEVLDLSDNNITGSLPLCFPPSSIRQVHLSRNNLRGQLIDTAFYNSSSLVTLDLRLNHFEGSIPKWIGGLLNLNYLILSKNDIQGEVPIQLCQLNQLRLIDFSHNKFLGHIPSCLNITIVPVSSRFFNDSSSYAYVLTHSLRKEETIEFTTKSISYSYQGRILKYMSGIDLSYNNLTGEIPHQIGDLVGIHTLNLSYNNLTGPIPQAFSNLKQIESMDLSYNNLNETIPPQLVEITTLAVFSVAHNNLSGKIPDMIAQFGTFEASSYEGNPLLCGQPLPKSCNTIDSPSVTPNALIDNGEGEDFIDMDIFYISFAVTYTIMLLGIVVILYINPRWRHKWFYLVETWMTFCYYFVIDHLAKWFSF